MAPPDNTSLARAAQAIHDRQVTSVELVKACLSRLSAMEPHLNAFAEVFPDKARVSASVADEQIRSGRYRGPLHGIPLGLKDNIAVSGWVTGAGSSFLKKRADRHAAVTTNLIDAGAVLVGRLNMDEFGCGISGNSEFGYVRNPWNPDRTTSGSSSGSAASVAAGVLPGSLGTDTSGSVLLPSAMCGVVGLRPTHGLVDARGVVPLAPGLDVVGPITRSVLDNLYLFDAMIGSHTQRSVVAPGPGDIETKWGLDTDVAGLRVGVLTDGHLTSDVHRPVSLALEVVVSLLEDLGLVISQ